MANFDPVHVSLNDRPDRILQVMDSLQARQADHAARHRRRRWVPWLLFAGGFPFLCADFLLGYNYLTFSLVCGGLWLAAGVAGWSLWRARPGPKFAPQYQTAREVIHTLRDDPDPKRGFFGHLDLSGAEQKSKLVREARNALSLAVEHYRDEWLSLKTRLYDGNMLRLSAIERVKVRKGYYKRSRVSGKQKWKAPKSASAQEIKVRLSVNPAVYEIKRQPPPQGARVGQYTVESYSAADGVIELAASAPPAAIPAADILAVLKLAYDQLQRKA